MRPISRALNRSRLAESPAMADQNIMRTKLTLPDLRMRMALRLSVAPRHWFNTLWSPKARAHERDAVRKELIEFITQGWEALDIEGTTPEPPSGQVPYSATETIADRET